MPPDTYTRDAIYLAQYAIEIRAIKLYADIYASGGKFLYGINTFTIAFRMYSELWYDATIVYHDAIHIYSYPHSNQWPAYGTFEMIKNDVHWGGINFIAPSNSNYGVGYVIATINN